MSKHSMPEMKEGGVNVTPLIDVVMCLIIFFMLVAKIGVTTGGTPMDLPQVIIGVKIEKLLGTMILNVTDPNIEGTDPATGKAIRKNTRLPIIVTADIEGNGKAKEIKLETVEISTGRKIDEPLTRVLKAALARNRDFSVTIRAQKELQFKDLQKVLLAIGKSGVTKINFAGAPKKV